MYNIDKMEKSSKEVKMKNFLLKIILTGLTLGLTPQGIFAMNGKRSTHSMQLRSRTRSNSVNRTTLQIDDPITPEEHHDFLNLYPNELDQKYAPIWKERFKVWEKAQIDKLFENFTPADTSYFSQANRNDLACCGKYCFSILSMVIFINLLVNTLISPGCPTLNPTYQEALQIDGVHKFNGILQGWACHLESKKYGPLLAIDPELQATATPSFSIMQLESVPQDGPTCAKYAFANLAAIDKLHREKRSIRAETIAQEIQLPLNIIGLPGQIEWKPFGFMPPFINPLQHYFILNYAKDFFPKNNFFMWLSDYNFARKASIVLEDIKIMINAIIATIEIHGIAHIYTTCSEHATAISIIKETDNTYRVIYMNSHNTPLSSIPQLTGWDATKKCYQDFKEFMINLKEKFIPKTNITLSDATKN